MTEEIADEPKVEPVAETAPAAADATRIVPSHTGSLPEDEVQRITTDLIGVLKTVYDPEIPVDIYELGLIYKVDLDDNRNLTIDMTLTAPGCPVAGEMPGWVCDAVMKVEGLKSCIVNLVFDPPWDQSLMSDEARLQLNMF